jgi:hypothetical protein
LPAGTAIDSLIDMRLSKPRLDGDLFAMTTLIAIFCLLDCGFDGSFLSVASTSISCSWEVVHCRDFYQETVGF